jgi:hypothetical protein
MKNLFMLSIFLLGIGLAACSQKNVPENIKKEFDQRFSGAISVKWDNESANEWEAEFKLNGKEMTAAFDVSGKWLETEAELSIKDLPEAVSNVLNTEFKDFKAGEVCTVENPEIKGYEIALKSKGERISVILAADGTILKKEAAGKESEAAEKKK